MGWRFATAQSLIKNPKDAKKPNIRKKRQPKRKRVLWRKGVYPVKR